MSYFFCDCNFCKSNNNNNKIYWKKAGFNIKQSELNNIDNIIWFRSSFISWRGYRNTNRLVYMYYIYSGYYIRINYNINAIRVPKLHMLIMKLSFILWNLCNKK